MILFGLLLSAVGSDIETGQSRMAFDIPELADGIGFVTVAMGVFGFAEIMRNLEHDREPRHRAEQGHRPDADLAGLQGRGAGDRARHGARLDPRHPAGRRRGDRGVRRLHVREEDVEDAGALRPRRDRRRGGAGKRQQRGGADLVHPAAHARHPAQRRDGADGRRDDDPRHRAGAAGDDQAAGPVLGPDRLDVGRQPDAGRSSTCRWSGCGCGCCACPTACCSRRS